MKLYDALMGEVCASCFLERAEAYPYQEKKIWPEHKSHELILQKEMAYELGGSGKPAVSLTCVSSNPAFFHGDEVLVIGSDLREWKSDAPYARISLLWTEDFEGETTESVYQTLQELDFVKYHVYPKGYMIRISGQSGREQVRVGKKELQKGLSFERIGNTFIRHYKESGKVKQVRMLFVTLPEVDYAKLEKLSVQANEIKYSLSKIKGGLSTECSSCEIREICDEVEGLRELHFGSKRRQKRGMTIR